MKKAKTILASLFIALASILVSACSCAGGSDVPSIYVTDIDLTCSSTSESVTIENGEIPTVYCHIGDTFSVEYNLAPSDATITQVNWEFSDYGLVESKMKDYTRSKSTKETVEFVAKGRSVERYQTTLTFIANINDSGNEATYKKAYCNIVVYDKVAELPTFVQPTNITFNNSTNTISWDRVSQIVTASGVTTNAELSGGLPLGLVGYEITKTNVDTNESTIDLVSPNVTKYDNLETGVTYDIKIRALADGHNVKSGDYSDSFKYYKLNEATELSNNNGQISFVTPDKSSDNRIYYNGLSGSSYITRSTTALTEIEVTATSVFNDAIGTDVFNIAVISYPHNYNSSTGYAEVDGVRYYPSTPKTNLVVQKLASPTVELRDSRVQSVTINGVTFTDVDEIKRPHASTVVAWGLNHDPYNQEYNQQFKYIISGGDLSSPITATTNDLSYSLEGLTANMSYIIQVISIGNPANTIESTPTTMTFNVVGHLESKDVTLSNDVITNNSTFKTGGLELFFVFQGTDASSYSKRVELTSDSSVDSYDISKIGLASGTYKVYGKSICRITGNDKNAVIAPRTYNELMTISVASQVSDVQMSRDGILTFTGVSGITAYKITVVQTHDADGAIKNQSPYTVEVYAPQNAGESADGYVHYTESNGVISLDIVEVVRYFFKDFQQVQEAEKPAEELERLVTGYMHYNNTLACQVQAKGYNDSDGSGTTVVSSSPSSALTFYKFAPIESLTLSDYKLYFDKVSTEQNQSYEIALKVVDPTGIEENKYYPLTHKSGWRIDSSSGKVVTDLTIEEYITISEGVTKTFVELIEPDKEHYIIIKALGFSGNQNSDAVLNSDANEYTFGITNQPYGLALNQEGTLTWMIDVSEEMSSGMTAEDYVAQDYKYLIKFYQVDTDTQELTYLASEDTKVSPNLVDTNTSDSDEGEDGVEELSNSTYITLKAYIGDILARYPDKVIAISVEEVKSDKFTGHSSSYFYATRLSSPRLSYLDNDGDNQIVWSSIANASLYPISVTKLGSTDAILTDEENEATIFSITSQTIGENPWSAGVYTISVIAGSEFAGSSTIENPFVLTSEASSITVYLVSQDLSVNVKGSEISWSNNFLGTGHDATYTIEYITGSSVTGTITDQTTMIYSSDLSKITLDVSDILTDGVNNVTITPNISFEDTGVVIIGSVRTNYVSRWDTAEGLATLNGNLVFNVYGATDVDSIDFDLYYTYDDLDGVYVKASKSTYSVLSAVAVNDTIPYILYTVVLDGLPEKTLSIKIVIKSEGMLDSELSDAVTGTKISSITDLEKIGDQLVWSAQSGISYYELGYKHANGEKFEKITLRVEEQDDHTYKTFLLQESTDEGTDSGYVEVTDEKGFYYKDGKFYFDFDYTLFIGDLTGRFYFNIRPLTVVDNYFSGNTSTAIVITKLNKNVDITVSNGVINIANYTSDDDLTKGPIQYYLAIYQLTTETVTDGEVETNVTVRTDKMYEVTPTGYTINENSPNIAPIDLNVVGLNDAGDYEIELIFLGNDNDIIDSESIIVNTLDKLDTTTLGTKEGSVVWQNPDGVTNYTLEISDGESTNYFTIQAGTDETILKESDLVLTDSSDSTEGEGEEVLTRNVSLFLLEPGKLYTLRVKSNANGMLHSKWSEPFVVKKLYAPTSVTISRNTQEFSIEQDVVTEDENGDEVITTQTVTILTGAPIVTWTSSNVTSQALNYELKYNESNKIEINEPTSLQYAINTAMSVGTYNLQLRVYGITSNDQTQVGLLTSDYSTGVTLKYISDVVDPVVSSGVLNWEPVEGAFSYRITATGNRVVDDEIVPTTITLHSTTNSIEFSRYTAFADLDSYYGNFTFEVNAITDPSLAIVSTSVTGDATNTVSLYKPRVLQNFKVKDGMLNWKIAVSDITDFVNAQDDLLPDSSHKVEDVISYVLDYINLDSSSDSDLENDIAHLLTVRLNINNREITDTPTSVVVTKGGVKQDSDYANCEYLEYSYDVSIEPTISSDTTSGDSSDNDDSESSVESQSIASTQSTIEYTAGKYVIKLSAIGNSSTTSPVVNGGYTDTLTAYKPTTPKTWSSNSSDIDNGRVQWGLSTTPNSTLTGFDYYEKYKITARPIETEGIRETIVNVSDTEDASGKNDNLINGYQYYRDLKGDLFEAPVQGATGTNVLVYNTYYKLLINTVGTTDSEDADELSASNGIIYLNSNSCEVGAVANILDTSANVKTQNSNLSWNTSYGSTYTKLFVYGPFDNLNTDKTARNADWASAVSNDTLDLIYASYYGDTSLLTGLTDEKIEEYASMLRVIDLGEDGGSRVHDYTLTNDASYSAGGYIFKFQEIGDNKGVIDSDISKTYAVEKLGTPTAQNGSWIGTSASNVWVWGGSSDDKWNVADYENSKIGTFVWNYVPGANAYRVELFKQHKDDSNAVSILEDIYTRETRYDLPNGVDFNQTDYKYFIRITAIRTLEDKITQLEDNFFSGDDVDTTSHFRLAVPSDLTIYGSGTIEWDAGISYDNIGGYRVQYSYGDNVSDVDVGGSTSSAVPHFDLGTGEQNGTIAIAIKALAEDIGGEHAWLNSSYCTPVEVTRLADPQVRLIDGVFNWGTGSDPLTNTELTIDTNDTEIILKDSAITSLTYFTDVTEHDGTYVPSADTRLYPVGEHTFKVRFQGTGGDEGYTMTGSDDFYIASNLKELTATKLATPTVQNVALELSSTSENMVMWAPIDNAVGYRIRIFYSNTTNYTTLDVATTELLDILGGAQSDYYAVSGSGNTLETIYFKLNDIIASSGMNGSEGGALYIYVQALGSGILGTDAYPEFEDGSQTNQLYLSSSYSNYTTVALPPAPEQISYNNDEGVLSWVVDSTEAFGIKLVNEYTVNSVSEDDFNNYWKLSANYMGTSASDLSQMTEDRYVPYEELISRTVIYTLDSTSNTYTLQVTDILYLPVEEVLEENEDGELKVVGYKTPTSYKLTTIATNYQFHITAIAFASDDIDKSEFASDTVGYPGIGSGVVITFDRFGKGDGSELYPYTIKDYSQFNRIRLFTDRHFTIISDINLIDANSKQSTWTTIAGDFTGSIEGNGHTISNFVVSQITSGGTGMLSLVENNKGTISNLTINANISDSDTHSSLMASAVAIKNYGIIDNVHVTGIISIKAKKITNTAIGTQVGGLVVENSGTISNSSVNAEITALDDSTAMVFAGGIARINYGTIYNTNFAGTTSSYTVTSDSNTYTYYTSTAYIRSNYIGGITATNYGTIDRCYVDNAVLYVTDSATTESYRKGATAGGIAGEISVDLTATVTTPASITNSYSKAYIYASRQTSDTYSMSIGGLVGSCVDNVNITISNNYVVARIAVEDGKTVSASGLSIYDMMATTVTQYATINNNYYIVEGISGGLSASSDSSRNDNYVTKKDSLVSLRTALASLTDSSGNIVYNIPSDETAYPTLNAVNN